MNIILAKSRQVSLAFLVSCESTLFFFRSSLNVVSQDLGLVVVIFWLAGCIRHGHVDGEISRAGDSWTVSFKEEFSSI